MREFKVLKSASSNNQLRRVLRVEDLDKFGEPFTPEFVYEAIRQLSRFASMRVSLLIKCITISVPANSFVAGSSAGCRGVFRFSFAVS